MQNSNQKAQPASAASGGPSASATAKPPTKSWASLAAAAADKTAPPAPVAPVVKKAPKTGGAKKPFNPNKKSSKKEGFGQANQGDRPGVGKGDREDIVPMKEEMERYKIVVTGTLESRIEEILSSKLSKGHLLSEERMLNGGFCPPENVKDLWKEKERIDSFFDEKQETCYYKARNSVFPIIPQKEKRTRSGDKLWEVHMGIGLFQADGGVFLDVCGGPGAWSEVMLSDPRKKWSGFGMTLKLPTTPQTDLWYAHLETDDRWKPLWGVDGTGNIFDVRNLDHVKDELARRGQSLSLVLGDGGYHVTTNAEGKHMEHLQELYSFRHIFGELLACIKCLSENGNWCCKVFDTFSSLTASVVYITGLLFEQTFIVKPCRSRIVNSERYLVGKKFRARTPALERLIDHLTKIYASWSEDYNDGSHPIALISKELMEADKTFFASFSNSVQDLCKKQTLALKQVMDLAVEIRKSEEKKPADN